MTARGPDEDTISIVPSNKDEHYGTGEQHTLRLGGSDVHVIPVIFVPGVMGSRLKNEQGEKAWDPDDKSFMLFDYGLWEVNAAAKKEKLIGGSTYNPDFLQVYDDDPVHNLVIAKDLPSYLFHLEDFATRGDDITSTLVDLGLGDLLREEAEEWLAEATDWSGWSDIEDAARVKDQIAKSAQEAAVEQGDKRGLARVIERGWGGIFWGGYGPFVEAFQRESRRAVRAAMERRLEREGVNTTGDTLDRMAARLQLPLYTFGYNWTNSCRTSGEELAAYIDDVIERYEHPQATCEDVILITHSMGGLVTRSACKLHDVEDTVRGVIHGVQPALGAAAMHWRAKCGFRRATPKQVFEESNIQPDAVESLVSENGEHEGSISWLTNVRGAVMAEVLGANGREVTALTGNMPGLIELAPSHQYRSNAGEKAWLKVIDETGKAGDRELERPEDDVWEEVHKVKLEEDAFWATVKPELLVPESPDDAAAVDQAWEQYTEFVDQAQAFHEDIEDYAHPRTFNFYGGGDPVRRMEGDELTDTFTADEVVYRIRPYTWEDALEEGTEDSVEQALEGDFDPQATLGELKENIGSPEQMAQAVAERAEGDLTGDTSGGLKGGKDAVSAGKEALGAGKEALNAAKGAYQTAKSGFQEILQACREAVEAAQHVAESSRRSIQATLKALRMCQESIERIADTVENGEQALEDLLDEVREHLEEEAEEALREAYREVLDKAREAVDEGRRVLSDAIAAAERAAQEAAQAAQSALTAGKQAFQAGEKALQDALAAGEDTAQKIEDASREALEAAEAALEAGREALEASCEVVQEALEGLNEVHETTLEVARYAEQAIDAIEEIVQSEDGDRSRSDPVEEALRALREVLLAVEAARATIEAARSSTEEVLSAAEEAEEALRTAVEPVREAFKTAEETIHGILAASAEAMNRVVQQGKQRLDEAESALNEGEEQTIEHVESALSEADEALSSGWEQLDEAGQAVLASAAHDFEEAPEAIMERAWTMLEDAVQEALSETKEDTVGTLDEVLDAIEEAYESWKESVEAGERALEAAQRVVDLGADTLNDLLHASEEVAEKTEDAGQKAGEALQAASNIRAEKPTVENVEADVQSTEESPASFPAYPDKYQDGRMHPQYKRGGFEAYFAADDGTVLKAVLEDPQGVGDSTVSLYSGRALASQEKSPEEYAPDYDLQREEALFAPLMHEPAYKSAEVQTFTVERVVHLFAVDAVKGIMEEK